MAQLGECAVFYFKYRPEMLRLYWQQESSAETKDDENVKKMATAVGNQCCLEIGEFLTECAKIIESHLQSINAQYEQSKLSSKQDWSVAYAVAPKGRKRPWRMQAGVDIPTERAEVIPWIWGEGKQQAEAVLKNRLGDAFQPSAGEDHLGPGAIALATIPIPVDSADGFALDRDALLDKIRQAFALIKDQMLIDMYADVMSL